MHSHSDTETMTLDEFLVEKPEASYVLEVGSDSMSEDGIYAKDLVIVERGRTPKMGDIVIVLSDGEYRLERFKRGGGVQVEAVVRALIRKYK